MSECLYRLADSQVYPRSVSYRFNHWSSLRKLSKYAMYYYFVDELYIFQLLPCQRRILFAYASRLSAIWGIMNREQAPLSNLPRPMCLKRATIQLQCEESKGGGAENAGGLGGLSSASCR